MDFDADYDYRTGSGNPLEYQVATLEKTIEKLQEQVETLQQVQQAYKEVTLILARQSLRGYFIHFEDYNIILNLLGVENA